MNTGRQPAVNPILGKRIISLIVRQGVRPIFGCMAIIALVLGIAVFAFQPEARATMVAMSTAELVKASDIVIVGDVTATHAFWTAGKQSIVTKAAVNITEIVSGATPKVAIVVEYEGGEVDGIVVGMSDAPTFAKGEKTLVFLKAAKSKHDGSDVYVVVSGAQGKYVIINGIAKKVGFSATGDTSAVDNNLPVEQLIAKIKGVK
jgi:hypothetical protein